MEVKCCECNKDIPRLPFRREYSLYLKSKIIGYGMFCSDECYKEYLSKHFVEEYEGQKIYQEIIDGEVYYFPYAGCKYAYKNIEDCKIRIDLANNQGVGVY